VILALLAAAAVALPGNPSAAVPLSQGASIIPAAKESSRDVEKAFRGGRGGGVRYRGGAAWRGGAVARRGGAAVRRGGAWGYRGGAGVRTGGAVVRRGGAVVWRRPASYWWPAGGAIAAGAAIGVVSAATAAAWAGAAPAPGYCWYYTDPSRRQGFWDVCR
jgi:hypothetical protein